MLHFRTTIQKFGKQGEKTGWQYIAITAAQAAELKPGTKTSFRVKGTVDNYAIEKAALLPMGEGSFIFPLNATVRKTIRKAAGAEVLVTLELDSRPWPMDEDFLECLGDDPAAAQFFATLPKGHQVYFSRWIGSAKTAATKAARIARAVDALTRGMGYSQMVQAQKAANKELGR